MFSSARDAAWPGRVPKGRRDTLRLTVRSTNLHVMDESKMIRGRRVVFERNEPTRGPVKYLRYSLDGGGRA
jgi:hypothetical protein